MAVTKGVEAVTNEELIQAYQGGDETALEYLVEKNKGLVFMVSNSFEKIGKLASFTIKDIEQEAWIAFINAVESYSTNEEYAFSTYIINNIRWHMYRQLREHVPKLKKNDNESIVHISSIDRPIKNNGEEDTLLVDMMACESSAEAFELANEKLDLQILRRDLIQLLEDVFHHINDMKTLNFMFLHYGLSSMEPMSIEELTVIFNLTTAALTNIRTKALRQIRTSKEGRCFMARYRSYFLGELESSINEYSPERAVIQIETYEQTKRKLEEYEGES